MYYLVFKYFVIPDRLCKGASASHYTISLWLTQIIKLWVSRIQFQPLLLMYCTGSVSASVASFALGAFRRLFELKADPSCLLFFFFFGLCPLINKKVNRIFVLALKLFFIEVHRSHFLRAPLLQKACC